MAIHDNDSTQNTAKGGNQPFFGGNSENGQWGLSNIDQLTGLSRHITSETLSQTTKHIQEIIESAIQANQFPKNFNLNVIQVDNQKYGNLYLSSIVFAATDTKADKPVIAYHTLLLEGSNAPTENRVKSIQLGNQSTNITEYVLTSDVFDSEYLKTINEILSKEFNSDNLLDCSGEILPRDFDLSDKVALRSLTMNAIIPVFTELSRRRADTPDMDLSKFTKDSIMTANINYHNKDKVDYAGHPIRNSVEIRLVGQTTQRQTNNSLNSGARQVPVSEANGFIDLLWSPAQAQQGMYVPQSNQPTQKYQPRLVITRLENQILTTIPAQLLALASAAAIIPNNAFWQYWQPRPIAGGKNAIDMVDIGATNIESNIIADPAKPNQRIDTKGASFGDQQLGQFLAMSLVPGLMISLDVSECGSDTYQNEVFTAAALGNKDANKAIIAAANVLTGGNFTKYYTPEKGDPVLAGTERIYMGYYENKDGQKQDIRAVDYLALLNIHGDKDPTIGEKYSSIWLNQGEPIEIRMDRLAKLIEASVGGQFTFTGYGRRVTFNYALFEALQNAIRACGVEVRLNSTNLGVNYQHQRATFANQQAAVLMNNASMFNTGINNNPVNPNGFGYNRQSRF